MRAPPADHWSDTLPADDRQRYAEAWQAYRCCRDCRHWQGDDDGEGVGCCDLITMGALLTPEDYTCDEFVAIRARDTDQ